MSRATNTALFLHCPAIKVRGSRVTSIEAVQAWAAARANTQAKSYIIPARTNEHQAARAVAEARRILGVDGESSGT